MNVATDDRVAGGKTAHAWARLAMWAGWLTAVAMGAVSVMLGDLEGAVVTVAFVVSMLLLRMGKGTIGALGLALISGITLFFMLAAAIANAQYGSPLVAVLMSAGLGSLSLAAGIAAVGHLVSRGSVGRFGAVITVVSSAVLFVVLTGWALTTEATVSQNVDIRLVSENAAFSPRGLSSTAGEITVQMENRDLFWHTFTIETLGVDLRVPVGGELDVSFDAPAGTYEFVCAIPGHREAGMVGTLVITDSGT